MPQFTKNSVISFPMHVDLHHDCNSPYQFILGLDVIIELGITINGMNKSIEWEGTTIPIKQINVQPLLSNELTIGKPNFAIIERISYEHKQNELHRIINDKISARSRSSLNKKTYKFINHCVKYMGLLNTIFATVTALCTDTPVSNENVHYYTNEDTEMNYSLYNKFDFNKTPSYNDNVFRLNTLHERYNPMPMNEVDLDEFYFNEYADNWDNNINQWWEDAFTPQEFLYSSKTKLRTNIQQSDYHSYTINDVLNEHSVLSKPILN